MNLKRVFGTLLTVLGAVGLIYAAVLFANTSGTNAQIRGMIIYGLLGFLFFVTGIGLVRNTADTAK